MKVGDLISVREGESWSPRSRCGLVIEVHGPYFRILWGNGNVNCPSSGFLNNFMVVQST